ncbi:MAG: nucleoside deaminase [candidate division WOR-3 bacterium]
MKFNDISFMEEAIKEAELALKENEVPVGAVIVYKNKIIGRGHNQMERLKDPTAHAEILAISSACNYLKDWRLKDATIYITCEPCLMCMGAILLARIKKVVYGTKEENFGFFSNYPRIYYAIKEKIEIIDGIKEEETRDLLKKFFRKKRK